MPLTPKGTKIRKKMREHYGKKKGDDVFNAMITEGKLKGVEGKKRRKRNDT